MPQRIKPTDVTAAFRAARAAADAAGVDTTGWTLRSHGGATFVIERDDDEGRHPVERLGTTYRECFDALHSMRAAWDLAPRTGRLLEQLEVHKRHTGIEVEVSGDKGWTTARDLLQR